MYNNDYREKKPNDEKQKNEINTTFPMEFPSKNVSAENHIVDVVVNEVFPPKSESVSKNKSLE